MADEQQRLREAEAAQWWEWKLASLSAAQEFGGATIKTLVLLNGGALVALGSYLGTNSASRGWMFSSLRDEITYVCLRFIGGLLAAALASGIAYFNYSIITESYPSPSELTKYITAGDVSGWRPKISRLATPTAWAAVVSSIVSAAAFCWGAWSASSLVVRIASGI